MILMTLRQAADKTARSITTLRRYIRAGRLDARKRNGRYGPEYFVSEEDLARAGLRPIADPGDPAAADDERALVPASAAAGEAIDLRRVLDEHVPLALFQELQMKHEQLLVQYGMMRAGGMRALEAKAELEARERELQDARHEIARLEGLIDSRPAELAAKLREAELELEGRRLEIAALQEKVRGLEMLTRNSVTNDSIDRQFGRVMQQLHKVGRIRRQASPAGPTSEAPPDWPSPSARDTDH